MSIGFADICYNNIMLIGNRLKELRKQQNLTQSYVANCLGINQNNVSDWENDKTRPEYENLAKLSKLYDTTTDYILGIENEDGTKNIINSFNNSNINNSNIKF